MGKFENKVKGGRKRPSSRNRRPGKVSTQLNPRGAVTTVKLKVGKRGGFTAPPPRTGPKGRIALDPFVVMGYLAVVALLLVAICFYQQRKSRERRALLELRRQAWTNEPDKDAESRENESPPSPSSLAGTFLKRYGDEPVDPLGD